MRCAQRLALEAVEYASRTDSPVFIGRTLLDRSELLHLAGRDAEARAVAADALAVAEAKGDVASAARAVAAARGAPDVALADLPMPA
jgi:hypothetical protein